MFSVAESLHDAPSAVFHSKDVSLCFTVVCFFQTHSMYETKNETKVSLLVVEHPGPLVQTSDVRKWGFELVCFGTAVPTETLASTCQRSLYRLAMLRESREKALLNFPH